MRVLKEMARNIADIPEERIYLEFISVHPLERCMKRIEKWDEFHDVFRWTKGWYVTVSAVAEDTAVFRVADNWGRRRGKFVDGILHRHGQDETRVLVVDALSTGATWFVNGLILATFYTMLFGIFVGLTQQYGSSGVECFVLIFIVSAPFAYMWVYPTLSRKGYTTHNPVIARIRESLGDPDVLLKI